MKKSQILLIQNNGKLRDILYLSLQTYFNFEICVAESNEEAIDMLSGNNTLQAVICDQEVSSEPMEVFHFLIDQKINIPFFIINIGDSIPKAIYKGQQVAGMVFAPRIILSLKDLLEKFFEPEDLENADDYTEIAPHPLTHFDQICTDIYLKLSSGRFLKLYKQGDKVDIEDIDHYILKGVTEFYIQKKAAAWVLIQISVLYNREVEKIEKEKKPVAEDYFDVDVDEIELPKDANEGESVPDGGLDYADFNKKKIYGKKSDEEREVEDSPLEEDVDEEPAEGFDEDVPPDMNAPFRFEQEFMEDLHKKTNKIIKSINRNKNLKSALAKLKIDREATGYIKSRIGLVANISCAVAKELDWGSDVTFEKLIYLAHIHDITLFGDLLLLKIRTLEEFERFKEDLTEEQQKLYLDHPKAVADLIAADYKAPKDSDIIVLQHHEEPGQRGFPTQMQVSRIAPFAALLNISIALAQFILDDPEWTFRKFIKRHSTYYRGGHYTKIFKALENISL